KSWPRAWRRLLDPLDLGAGVVAVDRHVPGVADHARRDPHLRAVATGAGQRGGVDLAPDLAIVERVLAAAAEAAELAADLADHRFGGPEAEESAMFILDPLLGRGRSLLRLTLDGAVQPCVEARELLGAELVEAGGRELRRRHLRFDALLGQCRSGDEEQGGEDEAAYRHGVCSQGRGRASVDPRLSVDSGLPWPISWTSRPCWRCRHWGCCPTRSRRGCARRRLPAPRRASTRRACSRTRCRRWPCSTPTTR